MNKTLLCIFLLIGLYKNGVSQVTADAGPDVEICIYDSLKVNGKGLPSGDTGSYKWTNLSSNLVISNNSDIAIKINSTQAVSYQLEVTRVKNGITYMDLDTFLMTVNPLPTFINNGLPPICYSQFPIALTKKPMVVGQAGFDPNIKDTNNIFYYSYKPYTNNNPPNRVSKDSINGYMYDIRQYVSNSQIPSTGMRDTVCFSYVDPKGCVNKGCNYLRVYPNPVVEMNGGTFCQNTGPINLEQLVTKPFVKTGGIISFSCLSLPTYSTRDKDSVIETLSTTPITHQLNIGQSSDTTEAGNYTIEYGFKNAITGCQSFDTAVINVLKLPVLRFKPVNKFCINHLNFNLDTVAYDANTGKSLSFTTWKCVEYNGSRDLNNPNVSYKIQNAVINNVYFAPSVGTGNYLLLATDNSSGCQVIDSITYIVNGLPLVNIGWGGDTICAGMDSFVLTQSVPAGNVGYWYGPGVLGRAYHTQYSNFKKRIDGPYKMYYIYQHPLTTCINGDSTSLYVRHTPQLSISKIHITSDSSKQYYAEFTLKADGFLDTTKGTLTWNFYNKPQSYVGWQPGKIAFDSGKAKVIILYQDKNCWESDTVEFDINYNTSSILTQHIQLSFYPNPSQGKVNFEFKHKGVLSIYDLKGALQYNSEVEPGAIPIDLSSLNTGLYYVRFVTEEGMVGYNYLLKE